MTRSRPKPTPKSRSRINVAAPQVETPPVNRSEVSIELPHQALLGTAKGRETVGASAELFFRQGYDGTGLAQIAETVGMLKGSLYHYIDTKDDLLFAIIDSVHQSSLANLAGEEPLRGDAHVMLRRFINGHVRHFVDNFVAGGVFMHEFRSLSAQRRAVIVQERDVYEGYLRTLLRHGQSEGIVCPDVDVKIASMGIFGMMNWIYQWYRPGGDLSAERLADQFADIALGGIACTANDHEKGHKRRLGATADAADSPSREEDVDLDHVRDVAVRAASRSSTQARRRLPLTEAGTTA